MTKKYASQRLIPDATNELYGQDSLSLSILFTCRLYHTEGWKTLFSGNTFSFDLELRTWSKPIKVHVSRFGFYTEYSHCGLIDMSSPGHTIKWSFQKKLYYVLH